MLGHEFQRMCRSFSSRTASVGVEMEDDLSWLVEDVDLPTCEPVTKKPRLEPAVAEVVKETHDDNPLSVLQSELSTLPRNSVTWARALQKLLTHYLPGSSTRRYQ